MRREERLKQIPGQAGAREQEHERTPKRPTWRFAEREPWISHKLLEAGGRLDLRLSHGFQEEATPKGAAQGSGDLEERAARGFCHEARTSERIARWEANKRQKPGREEPEHRKTHGREGAIGALLDAKGQVDAQLLIGGRSASREGKQGRNRSCLQQEGLAGSIDGPLNVLGCLKQRFDSRSKRCQCADLII